MASPPTIHVVATGGTIANTSVGRIAIDDVIKSVTGLESLAQLETFSVKPGLGIHLTASVGLATLERADDTPETVFRRADSALFAAKRRGRNRVAANAA